MDVNCPSACGRVLSSDHWWRESMQACIPTTTESTEVLCVWLEWLQVTRNCAKSEASVARTNCRLGLGCTKHGAELSPLELGEGLGVQVHMHLLLL